MPWITYKNFSGNSSVVVYLIYNSGNMVIRFKGVGVFGGISSSTYYYTKDSAGSFNLTVMRSLARAGEGLNSFINSNKPRYAQRY